jgi:hypothetical protein
MSDPAIHGRFAWHELLTTNPGSAAAFFTRVIRWKAQTWSQDPSYTLFMAGGRPVAGLMALPPDVAMTGAPPHWLTYIGTPDVDRTVTRAAALGANILRPAADVAGAGRFAVVQDPQGAVFAVYTPLEDSSSDAAAAIGEYSWHELATTDWRAALDFYRNLFGWQATDAMDMGPTGMYQMFGRGGPSLGGIFNKPAEMVGPPAWLPYIRVADARRVPAAVAKAGGRIINGPMEVPGGDWIAQGLDAQGAVFAVHSLKPAAPKAARKPARPKRAVKAVTGRRQKATSRRVAPKRRAVTTRAKKGAKKTATKPAKKKARSQKRRR